MNVKLSVLSAAAALALLAVGGPAHAYRVGPMVMKLAPAGEQSTTTVRIENTDDRPITLEYSVQSVDIAEDGKEDRRPADADFIIFPPQSIVAPGKTQVLRIKYVGDPRLTASKTYRIGVRQVPVTLGEGASGVGITANFSLLATVVPQGAQPSVKVESITPDAKPNQWMVRVENVGSSYARMSATTWTFRDAAGRSKVVAGNQLVPGNSRNILLPAHKLVVPVKAPEGFDPKSTQIQIAADAKDQES